MCPQMNWHSGLLNAHLPVCFSFTDEELAPAFVAFLGDKHDGVEATSHSLNVE